MPVAHRTSVPEHSHLRPYTFHGVDLCVSGTHAIGDCPFCGSEGRFSVEISTGLRARRRGEATPSYSPVLSMKGLLRPRQPPSWPR